MVRQALGDTPDAEVRAGLLSTHLLGVALTRYILKLPAVVRIADDTMIEITADSVNRILTGPPAGRRRSASITEAQGMMQS
jgi:hypothetical protein